MSNETAGTRSPHKRKPVFRLGLGNKVKGAFGTLRALQRELGLLGGSWAFVRVLGRFVRLRSGQLPRIGEGRPHKALGGLYDAMVMPVAIFLDLRPRIGEERALAVARQVVVGQGVELMYDAFPARVREGSFEEFKGFVSEAMEEGEEIGLYRTTVGEDGAVDAPGELAFEIRDCLYARVSAALGAPQVGPLYCAVDGPFFRERFERVEFLRDDTIARGASHCDFRFRARNEGALEPEDAESGFMV